jgi:small subunit ribosomal protein S4
MRPRVEKLVRENMESLSGHEVPGWLEMNPAELSVKVLAMPSSDQIPFDINTNLIVEFYR